jgi:hypothetical protein
MQIKGKFFPDIPASIWIEQLSAELLKPASAQRDGTHIVNA